MIDLPVTALVLAAGRLKVTTGLLERIQSAQIVVAADNGARHAERLGRDIDMWVGDFDSSNPVLQTKLAHVLKQKYSTNKNQVDTELALQAAQALGASQTIILGAFGGRFDHALTIATAAMRSTLDGHPVRLDSGDEAAWCVTPGVKLKLKLNAGQTFSLISIQYDSVVTVTGARWPLEQALLQFGTGLGISNQALGQIEINLERGAVLVVVQYSKI